MTGDDAGVWASSDSVDWSTHLGEGAVASDRIAAVAATSFGLIAIGEDLDEPGVVWLSATGQEWERIEGALADTGRAPGNPKSQIFRERQRTQRRARPSS